MSETSLNLWLTASTWVALWSLTLGTHPAHCEDIALRPLPTATAPSFVSADPASQQVLPPALDPKVRINPEAPGPFIAMANAYQQGDRDTAKLYARQFVRYLNNVIFQVKDLTQIIGEAMIQEGTISEEDWVGAEQFLDREMASAREENGSLIKATHEEAMKRIKADPQNEVEVYYFFTLSCSWCRKMGADVERLWRATKGDKRVRMVALSLQSMPKALAASYKKHTGMTLPVMEGAKVAKAFHIGFVPAVVVVSPNTGAAYLKSGKTSFDRLYEFVRTVQGVSPAITPEISRVVSVPIGEGERASKQVVRYLPAPELASPAANRVPEITPVTDRAGPNSDAPSLGKF
jgi:hypothetical protein